MITITDYISNLCLSVSERKDQSSLYTFILHFQIYANVKGNNVCCN